MIQMRHALMQEKVRCNNRIQAFLDRNGVVMPPCKAFSKKWKHALMQYLGSGNISTELRYEYDHYIYLEKTNEQADQEIIGYTKTYWNQEYQMVRSITGFGILLPCYVIAFVHPIERFLSNRKLRRYAGVIPVAKESGDTTSKGRIPKTTSKALLRWALVQAANTIGKTNTKLGRYYRRKKNQKKNTGIAKIAVASTLVDIIFKVLTTKKPYTSATC
jgi:transposase